MDGGSKDGTLDVIRCNNDCISKYITIPINANIANLIRLLLDTSVSCCFLICNALGRVHLQTKRLKLSFGLTARKG